MHPPIPTRTPIVDPGLVRPAAGVGPGGMGARVAAILLVLASLVSPAWAQDSLGDSAVSPPTFRVLPDPAGVPTGGPAGGPSSSSPADQVGEVRIRLMEFGTGNIARVGDWGAIRLEIADSSPRQRTVLVRISIPDADGDRVTMQRELTTNPGLWQSLWMYIRLPLGFTPSEGTLQASVHEALERDPESAQGEPDLAERGPYEAGRRLGALTLTPSPGSVLPATAGLLGILGDRSLGLSAYRSGLTPTGAIDHHPDAHEPIELVLGLTPATLPDRWLGLAAFDTILWAQGRPEDLRGDRAAALRAWVVRGGHLIIVLPQAGQTWTSPASNELFDLLPRVGIERVEGASLASIRPLIARPPEPGLADRFPSRGTLQILTPLPDAGRTDAITVLAGPDGRGLVSRRLVGAGAVTLIGIDLNQSALSADVIAADLFWHRVLGRRGDFSPSATSGPMPDRVDAIYDEFIDQAVSQTGRTAVGVLVGFIVFVAYWTLAGPIAYYVLRRHGLHQYSWGVFVALAGLFTLVSWGGASLLRPQRVEASHLTFLDVVWGQGVHKARTWGSVLVPWYGQATLSMDTGPIPPDSPLVNALGAAGGSAGGVSARASLAAITPWEGSADPSAWTAFNDAGPYVLDATGPEALPIRARSTVKQFQMDWAGLSPWSFPAPQPGPDGIADLVRGPADPNGPLVTGVLTHGLPGPLIDVTVVVVMGQLPVGVQGPAAPCDARVFALPSWAPGEPLDLAALTTPPVAASPMVRTASLFENWMRTRTPRVAGTFAEQLTLPPADDRLTDLAFFPLLDPPARGTQNAQAALARQSSHTLDIARSLSTPGVIVVGRLERAEAPFPITLDGSVAPTRGTTVLRWIYPLPANPPRYLSP